MRVYEPAMGRVKETHDLADTMRVGRMLATSVYGALKCRGVCYVRVAGREYNYAVWKPSQAEFQLLKEVHHAGDVAPDFTLPLLDGGELSLSDPGGNAAR